MRINNIAPLNKHRNLIKRLLIFLLTIFTMLASMAQIEALNKALFNVKDYAAKGNGKMFDTKAINKAIVAAAAAGGGTVYFRPGVYLSTSIELKSNITLYLAAGSTIEAASDSIEKYNLPEPNEAAGNYQDYGHSHWKNSLIWGIGLDHVSILGPGLIYGKGLNPGF